MEEISKRSSLPAKVCTRADWRELAGSEMRRSPPLRWSPELARKRIRGTNIWRRIGQERPPTDPAGGCQWAELILPQLSLKPERATRAAAAAPTPTRARCTAGQIVIAALPYRARSLPSSGWLPSPCRSELAPAETVNA